METTTINPTQLIEAAIKELNSIQPLTEEAKNDIRPIFEVKLIPKNTLVVKEGQVVRKVWFLCSGLLRSFFHKDGKEATTWLMIDKFPFTNYRSFITEQPSIDNIITIEDSLVLETTREKLYDLYEKHICVNSLSRQLAEIYFLRHDEHVNDLLFSSSEERFNKFMLKMPNVIERLKLKDVASYLGMTKETMSRIRHKNDNLLFKNTLKTPVRKNKFKSMKTL